MYATLAILTFVASFLGTIAGFGSSTMMIPVAILLFPLPQALLFVGIIHMFNDIWEMVLFKGKVNWKMFLFFGLSGALLSIVGANLALSVSPITLSRILGIILLGYVILFRKKPDFSLPNTPASYLTGGALSGFMAGIFGIGGPVRSLFLTSYKLPKKSYLFTIGTLSLIVDATRVAAYYIGGARLPNNLWISILVLIPISYFAAQMAKTVVDKLPQRVFRIVISIFLLVIGIKFLIFP